MLTWMLVNVGVSLLALLFIKLNATAPHRLRFFAGFAALAAWLVPWTVLPELPPGFQRLAGDFGWELWRMERIVDASSARVTGVYPIIVETSGMPLAQDFMVLNVLELVFIALSSTGIALFLSSLSAHHYRLRRLASKSSDGNWLWRRAGLGAECPVIVQREIAGAFSSGLWRPRIWVHGDLVESEQLPTLLQHELTHIRQHDNWYLVVITLVEKVFWWNPFVWYLGRETRELQELSCDERCQRGISDYPAQLAQLMLDSAQVGKPRMLALSANILNNPNPNIKRIKLLQRSYVMKTRHIASAILTAITALSGIGIVTAQPEGAPAVAGRAVRVFELERAPGADEDVVFVARNRPVSGTRAIRANRGMTSSGADDQFVKINSLNGDEKISFRFTDTPLPAVLMPLVSFISGAGPGVLPLLTGADNALMRELDEDVTFAARVPAPGEGALQTRFFVSQANDNLVLEHADAANRIVSVSGTDLTLDEAIDLIAEQSGCNIFREDDKLVVDYCETRPGPVTTP